MALAVGIDLGTTKSVVAAMRAGDVEVVVTSNGARRVPSIVAFTATGEVLVGAAAERQSISNSERTYWSFKHLLGRIQDRIVVDGRRYSPEDLAVLILRKLKSESERYLEDEVTQAVITVPASYDESQVEATRRAAATAGFEVLRVLREPTAAALAYGFHKDDKDRTVVIFDLGGGTFDVSIVEIGDGVYEVKATSGDANLGGDDWDHAVVDWLLLAVRADHGVDLATNEVALERMRQAAEKAKVDLSSVERTEIYLPFIETTSDGPLHLNYELTRGRFEELTAALLDCCRDSVMRALKDAWVTVGAIDDVILVGGATRMPSVRELIREIFLKAPRTGVHPEEVVAVGAAIQAAILRGSVKDVLLLDVTPVSLGIETKGGVMTKLIERNTTIPTRRTEVFTTTEDMQSSIEIHVLEGEREIASYNNTLGRFQLDDLPPAPRGVPQIEVTFEIDANGIAHVSAKDRATNKEKSMAVTGPGTQLFADARGGTRRHRQASVHLPALPAAATPPVPPPESAGDDRTSDSDRADHQVFISYGSPDREYVSQLADHLQRSGLSVWLDTNLPHGATWLKSIQASIDACAVVVVVMSASSQDSHWVDCEIIYAREQQKPIFPLRLSGTRFFGLSDVQDEDVQGGRMPSDRFVREVFERATTAR